MVIDDELEAISKGMVMAYFEVNSQHIHVTTEDNNEYSQIYERRPTTVNTQPKA
jgi:hypothetical protein